MKKYVLAPLCSALVIPGLGQIINHDIKKGFTLLSMVFLLFVLGTIKLAFIIKSLMKQPETTPFLSGTILYLIILFALIWIYSVLDALWIGIKKERQPEGENR